MTVRKLSAALLLVSALVFQLCTLSVSSASYSVSELAGCSKVSVYSGKANAYFYGYSANVLVSVRVAEKPYARNMKITDGKICAACHDEENAYALVRHNDGKYYAARLNVLTGEQSVYELNINFKILTSSFAAADGCAYLMTVTNSYTEVSRCPFDGGKIKKLTVKNGAVYLFVNGSSAYACASTGEIYRLSETSAAYCAKISEGGEPCCAGDGWVLCENTLVSLSSSAASDCPAQRNMAVKTSEGLFYAAGNRLFCDGESVEKTDAIEAVAGFGGSIAVLTKGSRLSCFSFSGKTVQGSEQQSDTNEKSANQAKKVFEKVNADRLDCGLTVAQFKSRWSVELEIYDKNRHAVSSGKMKTGYIVKSPSGETAVSVLGDATGSGTVNSADVKRTMEHLTGKEILNGEYARAADMNGDGSLDNKDLVLLSRAQSR